MTSSDKDFPKDGEWQVFDWRRDVNSPASKMVNSPVNSAPSSHVSTSSPPVTYGEKENEGRNVAAWRESMSSAILEWQDKEENLGRQASQEMLEKCLSLARLMAAAIVRDCGNGKVGGWENILRAKALSMEWASKGKISIMVSQEMWDDMGWDTSDNPEDGNAVPSAIRKDGEIEWVCHVEWSGMRAEITADCHQWRFDMEKRIDALLQSTGKNSK